MFEIVVNGEENMKFIAFCIIALLMTACVSDRVYRTPEIGMTADQVDKETAWRNPTTKNRTTTKYGVSEQWVFRGCSTCKPRYLYFQNGVVTAIQDW